MTVFVRDLMTPDPETVTADATVGEMLEIMRQLRVRHLPVCDEDGKVIGIVSDRDLYRRSFEGQVHGVGTDGVTASDLMTYVVVSVKSTAEAGEAAEAMLRDKISSLPVIDGQELVGIITEADFVQAFVSP